MRGRHRVRFAIGFGLIGLLLAACGGNGEATTTLAAEQAPTTSAAPTTGAEEVTMEVTSSAFTEQGSIPVEYTCDGANISPPLQITDIPEGTVSLALIMDDPDAPGGTWDHWIAYDIRPTSEIPEDVGPLGTAGTNSFGTTGYGGPCPPSGTHRYMFTALALDTGLTLPEGARKQEVLEAAQGHILGRHTLTGLYQR